MRGLERNKIGFYYALYLDEIDAENADGKKTGGKVKTYGNPVFCRANIAPSRGNAEVEAFGKDLSYSRVLCISGRRLPITEESILWLYDGLDQWSDLTEKPFNFVVVGIAESLNGTLYALQQRGVDRR